MSDHADLQDLPLPALWQRARAVLKQLEVVPASDPRAQQLVHQGTACLRAAACAVDALALFSANEDKDDLATGDVKYLMIPFYQAEVLGHTHAADPGVRLAALNSAGRHYRAFLHRCRQYGLLSPPAAALVEAALQQEQGDEEDREGRNGGSARSMDAATLRQNKIEKFKREKYIKSRLEALEQQQQSGGAAAEEDGGDGSVGDGEEVERELWMLQADLAALQAAERLGLLRQEVEILRHAAAMPEDQRQRARQQREAAGPPTDLIRQLQAAAGNLTLSISGSAAVQRQQLAAGVFGPSHVLPTMSVEQFGELEYRRMLEQQQREAAAKERQQREQAERRADDIEEEEVQKARGWDEFKDDNPRGWGNSKLRPCG